MPTLILPEVPFTGAKWVPEATQPEVKPEVQQPEVPEVVEPEVQQPEVPEVVEPEVTPKTRKVKEPAVKLEVE